MLLSFVEDDGKRTEDLPMRSPFIDDVDRAHDERHTSRALDLNQACPAASCPAPGDGEAGPF
jgi:hypothetical protein